MNLEYLSLSGNLNFIKDRRGYEIIDLQKLQKLQFSISSSHLDRQAHLLLNFQIYLIQLI